MGNNQGTGTTVLSEEDSWQLLASADVVRVAVAVAGDVEVFLI